MDRKEVGRKVIRELMGEQFLKSKDEKRNEFNNAIWDYTEEVCFGRVWASDVIDRKQRSILNIAMLTALNRPAQLRTHVEGAINNGCSVAELQEILMQAAVYCGLPAAFDAFRVAEEILRERDLIN